MKIERDLAVYRVREKFQTANNGFYSANKRSTSIRFPKLNKNILYKEKHQTL
jgi:hypothetical protein